jgi:hypothetical protein
MHHLARTAFRGEALSLEKSCSILFLAIRRDAE